MPDAKITALTSIGTSTDPANDPLVIVDVNDTSMALTGTTKKVTLNQLLATSPTATLASATITGDLTVDTSTLKVDSANNRVGILTASPNAPLEVKAAGAQQRWDSGGATDARVELYANSLRQGTISWNTNSIDFAGDSSRSTVMTWGNVGGVFGTAMTLNSTGLGVGGSPLGALDIRGTSSLVYDGSGNLYALANFGTKGTSGGSLLVQTASVNSTYGSGLAIDGSYSSLVSTINIKALGVNSAAYSSQIAFSTTSSGSLVERMRIDSSGNVGVGVTPSASDGTLRTLNVGYTGIMYGFVGTSEASGFGSNYYYNGGWKYRVNGTATNFATSSGKFIWSNAASGTAGNAITWTDAMTLDASGNLLVGTTTAGGRLDVQTATGDCAARIKSNAAGSNATLAIDYVNSYGTHIIRKSGTDVWLAGVIADTGATPNYKIQNGSAVGVQLVSGATAWTTLSDETVKDIIEPIGNAVAKVGSLRSVIGKFKTDSEGTRRSFLIAQDVKSVLPEAVDVVGENSELGLRYTEVIPLLVAAIKELTARVEALEA